MVSTTGLRMGRTGSKRPQLCLAETLAVPSESLAGWEARADLLFRPRFLPRAAAPLSVPVRARDETAALRAAKSSLQYCAWPSFAPRSIAPGTISRDQGKLGDVAYP
jgi:hypothetical protein